MLVAALLINATKSESPRKVESVAVSNPVVGFVTQATQTSLSIRTRDGNDIVFTNDAHDPSVEHLKEHQADNEPVSITWRAEGNKKIVTRIDDAL
jgi:hypothetical protein